MPIVFLYLNFPFLPQSSFPDFIAFPSRFYSFSVPIFTSLSSSPCLRFFFYSISTLSSSLRFFTCDSFSPPVILPYSNSIFSLFPFLLLYFIPIRFLCFLFDFLLPQSSFSRFYSFSIPILYLPRPDYFLPFLLLTLAISLLLNFNFLFKPAIFYLWFLFPTCDFSLPNAV